LQVFRRLTNADQTINDRQVDDGKQKDSSNDNVKRHFEKQDRSEYYSDYEDNDTKK